MLTPAEFVAITTIVFASPEIPEPTIYKLYAPSQELCEQYCVDQLDNLALCDHAIHRATCKCVPTNAIPPNE